MTVSSVLAALCILAGMSVVEEHIFSEMEDPLISEHPTPVPGLVHFSAFERAWLVEDPIVPMHFYRFMDGPVTEGLPMDDIVYVPESPLDARETGLWLLSEIYRYFLPLHVSVEATEEGYLITASGDYHLVHPMFGQPASSAEFLVNSSLGRWTVTRKGCPGP